MRSPIRGAVLLEVLVALAILSSAGVALLALASQVLDATTRAAERERLLAVEERVLTAHMLLTAVDLDRRLGRRTMGEVVVEIQRPTSGLYRVAVGPAESDAADLVTVIHRPTRGR